MFPGHLAQSSPRSFRRPEPAPPRFRVTVRLFDRGLRELKVEGELDLAVADQLKEEIAKAAGCAVLIDLSECTFIDSTGLAVVLLARRDGGRVAIHSPSEPVERTLSVTGLTGDGLVFDGRAAAVSRLTVEAGGG
jgi:anti-anti-sigma factor